MTDTLARALREALAAEADPVRAPGQQSYMKSETPFLGVPVPRVRRITTELTRDERDADRLLTVAGTLWDGATHREHRYAAMAVLRSRWLRGDERVIDLVDHMVRTGHWWDITDELAHRVTERLDQEPAATARLVRAWAVDDDMWIRRVAIIAQLGRREDLDRVLLLDAIEPNTTHADFFIRKAIGWALRDAARTHPEWVRQVVATRDLSPLSVREATKHL